MLSNIKRKIKQKAIYTIMYKYKFHGGGGIGVAVWERVMDSNSGLDQKIRWPIHKTVEICPEHNLERQMDKREAIPGPAQDIRETKREEDEVG